MHFYLCSKLIKMKDIKLILLLVSWTFAQLFSQNKNDISQFN